MNLPNILGHKSVAIVRDVIGELAIGLALAWWFLMPLELMRATLVSAYLNLNFILALAVLLWLIGTPRPGAKRRPYVSGIASAILVGAMSYILAPGLPYSLPFALLAGVATIGLWLVASGAYRENNNSLGNTIQ